MTEAEAKALSERLAEEHPDRLTHRWAPRKGDGGDWEVVKVPAPSAKDLRPVPEEQEKPPRPPSVEDGNLPGGVSPWAAGGG